MEKTCCIFGAGEYGTPEYFPALPEDCLLIAADGGYARLKEHGLTPHLAVGDFDSLGWVPEDTEVLKHPAEKDDTDMMLALREGMARGFGRFLIYGGMGGRLDHTVANFQLLDFLACRGGHGFLLGAREGAVILRNGTLTFPPEYQGTLSLFAWGGAAEGVTLTGLRYPLTEHTMTPDLPLGVSNEFTGQPAVIRVRRGALLALWSLPQAAPLPVFL